MPNSTYISQLDPVEQEKAMQTAEQTVTESKRFINPNIPPLLKATGIAVVLYIIFFTGKS